MKSNYIILGFIIAVGFAFLGLHTTESPKSFQAPKNLTAQIRFTENNAPESSRCEVENSATIIRVIDGDTVVSEGGYRIRLLYINADEKGDPCYNQAKQRLEELVLGKKVYLESDTSDVDLYKRCLRVIFYRGANINKQMVLEGMASAKFYPPDVKYREEITAAERFAKEQGLGCRWQ